MKKLSQIWQRKRYQQLLLFFLFGLSACLVLSVPEVQRRILISQAEKYTQHFDVEYVHILPWLVKIRGMDIALDGTDAQMADFQARFCVTKLLWRVIHFHEVVARDVQISLPQPDPNAASKPIAGIFPIIQKGFRLQLDSFIANVDLKIANTLETTIKIPHGELIADGSGSVDINIMASRPGDDVDLAVQGSLRLTQSEDAGIVNLGGPLAIQVQGLTDEPLALEFDTWITPLTKQQAATQDEPPTTIVYGDKIRISASVPSRAISGIALNLSAAFDSTDNSLTAKYDINVDPEWLHQVIGNESAPNIAESGSGKFAVNLTDLSIDANYQGNTRFTTLERLLHQNEDLPKDLRLTKEIEVSGNVESLTIERLVTGVSSEANPDLVSLKLNEQIEILLNQPGRLLETERRLAEFKISSVPIEWASGLVPDASFHQGAVSGTFAFDTGNNSLKLVPIEPLILSATNLEAGEIPVKQISLSMTPSMLYTENEIDLDIASFVLKVGKQKAVELSLNARIPRSEDNPPMTVATKGKVAIDQIKGLTALQDWVTKYPSPDKLNLEFDSQLKIEPQMIGVDQLKISLTQAGENLLKVNGLQKFQIGLGDETDVAYQPGDLASIEFADIPLAWVDPYLPEYEISGKLIAGGFRVSNSGNNAFKIEPLNPLNIQDFNLTKGRERLARDVDINISPTVNYKKDAIVVSYSGLDVRTGRARLLNGNGEILLPRLAGGGFGLNVDITGSNTLYPKALMRQPAIAAFAEYDLGKMRWRVQSDYGIKYSPDRIELGQFDTTILVGNEPKLRLNSQGKTTIRPTIKKTEAIAQHLIGNVTIEIIELGSGDLADLISLNGFTFDGINGRVVVHSNGELLRAKFSEPLRLNNGSLKNENAALVNPFNFSATGEVSTEGSTLEGNLSQVALTFMAHPDKPAVLGELQFRVDPNRAIKLEQLQAKISGNIPVLLNQPLALPGHSLLNGHYAITSTVAPNGDIAGDLSIDQLSADKPLAIDGVSAKASGKVALSGRGFNFSMPIVGRGKSGETDGLLTADFAPKTKQDLEIELNLLSKQFFLNDMLAALSAVQKNAPKAKKKKQKKDDKNKDLAKSQQKTAINESPDKRAFWNFLPYDTELKYQIERLFYTDYVVLNDVAGRINTTPERLGIEELTAHFHESPMKFDGNMTFTENATSPYDIKLKGTVDEFNLNQFFSELIPGTKPRVEGLFAVAIDAYGSSPNMSQYRNNLFFDMKLKSREGLFRPLPPDSVLMTGASNVLGFFGEGLSYLPTGGFGAGTLSRIVNYIKEIDYDFINIRVTRGESRDIAIKQFVVRSPTIRLTAKGGIDYAPGKDVIDSPLTLDARLNMSGKGAAILYSMDLLKDEQDRYGYYLGPAFEIRGTPSDAESNFAEIITASAEGTVKGGVTRPISGLIGNIKHRWFGGDTRAADPDDSAKLDENKPMPPESASPVVP